VGLRTDAPDLWRGIVGWCREIGIDWPEDDIAAVIAKVRSSEPEQIPDDIGRVLEWCRKAEQDSDQARAHVELWRMAELPIEIMVSDTGEITHRLDPDANAEMTDD